MAHIYRLIAAVALIFTAAAAHAAGPVATYFVQSSSPQFVTSNYGNQEAACAAAAAMFGGITQLSIQSRLNDGQCQLLYNNSVERTLSISESLACPSNQKLEGNQCVPLSCPAGQKLVDGVCVDEPKDCPAAGTVSGSISWPGSNPTMSVCEPYSGKHCTAVAQGLCADYGDGKGYSCAGEAKFTGATCTPST
ncbi:hypothetical protein ACFX58_19695, partial [Sphingomonas sp. NCPPB 2930]